jgi:hypothetical protein
MPIIGIPTKVREKLRELADRELTASNANPCFTLKDIAQAETAGFFAALRAVLPSELVGLLVMDYDNFLEGGDAFTEILPRLVL